MLQIYHDDDILTKEAQDALTEGANAAHDMTILEIELRGIIAKGVDE